MTRGRREREEAALQRESPRRGVQLVAHLASTPAGEMAAALQPHSFLELALPSSASDAASSLCSEAPPSPVNWCAGLGAACRGCAEAFRHTRSAYTELRQDQLDALNRRRQAEMIVFEDTSSSGGGTLSLVPSVASVSAVPSSASAGSSACASPLQRRNSAELLGAPLPPESSAS